MVAEAAAPKHASPARPGVLASIWQRRWPIGLAVAILAGSVFRLLWLSDVEYKGDEAWTFNAVQSFWATHRWPAVGMPSSAGFPNAGLSLWLFIAISAVLPSIDPLALTRAVQLLNIVALLGLGAFAWRVVRAEEREPWLWALALVAVNPLAVLFSRKLWPPELLPLFVEAFLLGWWYRRRWWGALMWGAVGALLGQIQLTGFLFTAAFLGASLLGERGKIAWRSWMCGNLLGFLPMLPWLVSLAEGAKVEGAPALQNLLTPLIDWIGLAFGFALPYALGKDFPLFLAYPSVAGHALHLGAVLLILAGAVVVALLTRFFVQLRARPAQAIATLCGGAMPTTLALNAVFFGYGFALLLMLQPIFLHYFIIAFFFPSLWVAVLAQAGTGATPNARRTMRRLLAALVVIEACLTFLFLDYIQVAQHIDGDYGTAYGAQLQPPAP